jgi:hypothetical protein
MFYSQIDENGFIVKSMQFYDPLNEELQGLMLQGILVPDNPPVHNIFLQTRERIEPVTGDHVEYVIKDKSFPEDFKKDLHAARHFCDNKLGKNSILLDYFSTVHNLDTGQDLSNLFRVYDGDKTWGIKIVDGQVIEWYENNVTIDATNYSWISYDINDIITDKYIMEGDKLRKIPIDPNKPETTIHVFVPRMASPYLGPAIELNHSPDDIISRIIKSGKLVELYTFKENQLIVEYKKY